MVSSAPFKFGVQVQSIGTYRVSTAYTYIHTFLSLGTCTTFKSTALGVPGQVGFFRNRIQCMRHIIGE